MIEEESYSIRACRYLANHSVPLSNLHLIPFADWAARAVYWLTPHANRLKWRGAKRTEMRIGRAIPPLLQASLVADTIEKGFQKTGEQAKREIHSDTSCHPVGA